jgi:hypothetical protein
MPPHLAAMGPVANAVLASDTAIKESVRFSEEDADDPLMALSGV